MTADRLLLWLMRLNAAVLLCASPCVFLPFAWMNEVHRDWLGLGPLPDVPIIRYMARSLALLYATAGFLTLLVTLDWTRYRVFAPLIAWLHVGFGSAMLVIDVQAGLPGWWSAMEGPPLVGMGIVMLWLYRRASSERSGDQSGTA